MHKVFGSMRYLFYVLAIISIGCNQPYGNHYTVYIDPDFTVEQQDAISLACQEWEDIIPELKLDPQLGYCGGKHEGIICTHNWIDPKFEHDDLLAYTNRTTHYIFGVDGGDIYFDSLAIQSHRGKYSFYQSMTMTAAHEIGHAMGLSHDNRYPTIMALHISSSGDRPTSLDAQQWHDLR